MKLLHYVTYIITDISLYSCDHVVLTCPICQSMDVQSKLPRLSDPVLVPIRSPQSDTRVPQPCRMVPLH